LKLAPCPGGRVKRVATGGTSMYRTVRGRDPLRPGPSGLGPFPLSAQTHLVHEAAVRA